MKTVPKVADASNDEVLDEGIDADEDAYLSDDEVLKLYPSHNTPATMRITDEAAFEAYMNERVAFSGFPRTTKPAILPALGTSGCARMAERPKPTRKLKSVLLVDPAAKKDTKHLNTPNLDSVEDEFSSQVD